MKCPICGKDVVLQKKQVGLDESGNPILNEYAICKDCKKQWNLDKQRAKRRADKVAKKETPADDTAVIPQITEAVINEAPAVNPTEAVAEVSAATPEPVVETPEDAVTSETAAFAEAIAAAALTVEEDVAEELPKRVKKSTDPQRKKKVKKRPVDTDSDESAPKKRPLSPEEKAERAATNRPKQVKKRKKSVPEATKQVGLPRDLSSEYDQPSRKKRRPVAEDSDNYLGNVPPKKVRKKREHAVRQNYEDMLATDPRSIQNQKNNSQQEDSDTNVQTAHFRVIRVLLGIASIVGCGYFVYMGFTSGITSISDITDSTLGITYTVLASGMLLSGLLLLLMQETNNIFAFLLPMLIYLGCGTFAFLNRTEDSLFLYAAIACAVLAVLFIILAITSRGDEEDYDSFDDDDYYDDED